MGNEPLYYFCEHNSCVLWSSENMQSAWFSGCPILSDSNKNQTCVTKKPQLHKENIQYHKETTDICYYEIIPDILIVYLCYKINFIILSEIKVCQVRAKDSQNWLLNVCQEKTETKKWHKRSMIVSMVRQTTACLHFLWVYSRFHRRCATIVFARQLNDWGFMAMGHKSHIDCHKLDLSILK